MIYLRCECGNGLGVPGSFLGESLPCDDCGRSLRLVAGRELQDGRAVRWRLQVLKGPATAPADEQILLGGDAPIEIGTGVGKHLLLPGTLVSRQHCRLVPADDGWRIEDTNSRNGLFVNGTRVTQHVLQPDDVIRIGEYELRFTPVGKAAQPTPVPVLAAAPPPRRPRLDPAALGPRIAPAIVNPMAALGPGPTCPCCKKTLVHGARICIECGIDVKSGRALLTAQGLDEDTLHVRAENTIRLISWGIPFGLYPVASEARGNSKPYTVWVIAALTVFVSFVFFSFLWTAPEYELPAGANLMLWTGDHGYAIDEQTLVKIETRLDELEQRPSRQSAEEAAQLVRLLALAESPRLEFQAYQLLTHALLHGDLLHIAGNMLFLLVFGTRVNALLGNVKTAIIYPILAVAGGLGHLIASRNEPPSPMLGASGAIMGLAGMYLALFPAYRVHMVIWMRFGLLTGFKLAWKLFAVRGFWVVLFYVAFDVLATALGAEDGVAHWAHLGGLITGAAIALILLFTRLVNAYGGDMLSLVLGKHAWPLLGRPGHHPRPPPQALTASTA